MNRYELTYIIDTALEEEARKELIEKVSALIAQNGGEVEKIDETWGKRRLAYPINDKPEGYYVLVTMQAPAELPKEIERNLRINENVLRSLVIKLEEKKHSVKPRPVRVPVAAPVQEAAPAEEAAEEEIEEEPIKLRGETKICPVCKAEVDGDALFCNHCGAQL